MRVAPVTVGAIAALAAVLFFVFLSFRSVPPATAGRVDSDVRRHRRLRVPIPVTTGPAVAAAPGAAPVGPRDSFRLWVAADRGAVEITLNGVGDTDFDDISAGTLAEKVTAGSLTTYTLLPGVLYGVKPGTVAAFQLHGIVNGKAVRQMYAGTYSFVGTTLADAFGPGAGDTTPSALETINFPATFGAPAVSMARMFKACTALTALAGSFEGNFGLNATDMSGMFELCTGLENFFEVFPYGFGSNATIMDNMFRGSGIRVIDTGTLPFGFGSAASVTGMFAECAALETVETGAFPLDFGAGGTGYEDLFSLCGGLLTIASGAFAGFTAAASARNLRLMFYGCSSLGAFPAGTFPVGFGANVNITSMFNGCALLDNVYFPDGFATASPGGSFTGIFHECASLTVISPGAHTSTLLYLLSGNIGAIPTPAAVSLVFTSVNGTQTAADAPWTSYTSFMGII